MLNLQLALLRAEPSDPHFRNQVKQIASLLEGYPSIPAVAKELELTPQWLADTRWLVNSVQIRAHLRGPTGGRRAGSPRRRNSSGSRNAVTCSILSPRTVRTSTEWAVHSAPTS